MQSEPILVEILPTKIWVESDIMGARHVVLQHEGLEPFTYASFYYDYAYTSNSGTHAAVESLAKALGATEPIEHRSRELEWPTIESAQAQIAELQEFIAAASPATPGGQT